MDCRTHERGVGMLNTPYVKKDTIKNFFPVPNAAFDLGLHHMEISIYAYLLRIEDRPMYCQLSYYRKEAGHLGQYGGEVRCRAGGAWAHPNRAHGDHHQGRSQAQRLSQVHHPADPICH